MSKQARIRGKNGSVEPAVDAPHFEPRQRASRRRRMVYGLIFSLVWAVALALTAWVAFDTDAIALGLLIGVGSFIVAGALLGVAVLLRKHGPKPLLPRIPSRPQMSDRT